jgi:hypothetical protein
MAEWLASLMDADRPQFIALTILIEPTRLCSHAPRDQLLYLGWN